MTFGSLFAGIGGMDLGLERAGLECRWQVEIDEFASVVLAQHWPNVKRYGDIRTVTDVEPVDLIAGGFPCQDISSANQKRDGLSGARSGLWSEYFRLICLLRPRFVLIENVSALLTADDFGNIPIARVLGDLASVGMDAQWRVFRSCEFGASCPRQRVFILAYPSSLGLEARVFETRERTQAADARNDGHSESESRSYLLRRESFKRTLATEPSIVGVDHVIPARVGRIKGYGNAVDPTVAEWIGKRILAIDGLLRTTQATSIS